MRRIFLKIKEKLGAAFYLKPQEYAVSYSVRLNNLSAESNMITLVLPVPENLSNQKILKAPEFDIKPDDFGIEKEYGNNYAAWKFAMQAGEEKEIKMDFSVNVKPLTSEPKKKFGINDYAGDEIYKLYTRPNSLIHPEDEKIKSLAKKIRGTQDDVKEILAAINAYVVFNLKYGAPIKGLYSDIDALEKDEVDCGGFAALYSSLAIASGVPSRVVSGFWAGYENNTMHAWAESLMPDKTWLSADPATEQLRRNGRTKKFGRLGKTGSDRIILSKGCDLELVVGDDMIKTEILQNPIVIAEKGRESIECLWEFKTLS
ncbi:MAG: transglutaminase domain-containing protein [Patescibacteria group bacterium]